VGCIKHRPYDQKKLGAYCFSAESLLGHLVFKLALAGRGYTAQRARVFVLHAQLSLWDLLVLGEETVQLLELTAIIGANATACGCVTK